MPHEHWRGCKDWKDEGLPLSTTSDEAAKLFDAALTQCLSFREDESCGGLLKTLENLSKADPEFVLGRVLVYSLSLIWSNASPDDPNVKKELDLTFDLAEKQKNLTSREKSYVEAFGHLCKGYNSKFRDVLEKVLDQHPTDLAAYKLLYDSSVNNADKPRLKSFAERAWKSSLTGSDYLFGYKAFALCESGDYESSMVFAKKGLELIPTDIWSTHCLAHDYEMTGRYVEGQKFLDSTVKLWEPSNILTKHVHWHNALYSIEKGEYERALDVFDEKILQGIPVGFNTLDLCDAAALLYRLHFQGVCVKDRFDQIYEKCLSHVNDHQFSFADLHNLMALLGSGHGSEGEKFVQELRELATKNPDHPRDYLCVSAKVGVPLSEAILAYGKGHFDEAVDWIKPVENEIVKLGGSDAQRDVFSQLLLNAAVNSTHPDHQQYAEDLLKKRKQLRQDSPLTDRLMEKLLKLQQGRK